MALGWVPCPDLGVDDAECAVVEVALDRAHPSAGRQRLALARLPARAEPSRGQVWFVDGGPGDAGLDDLPALDRLRERVPDLSFLTWDHRGVGRSERLGCPEQEAPSSKDGAALAPEEWPACLTWLQTHEAARLPHLTVDEAAADLVELSDLAGEPGAPVWWWGVSYGTLLVQRALHLAPARPTAVLLDGLVPLDWTFAEFDPSMDQAGRAWLARCAREDACRRHFDQEPEAVAQRVLGDLRPGCRRLGLTPTLVQHLNAALVQAGGDFPWVMPAVWSRLERCDSGDRRAFIHMFQTLFPEEGGGRFDERPGHAPVLQRQVAYADLWPPPGSAAQGDSAPEGRLFSTGVSASFGELAAAWPASADPQGRPTQWASAEVPVLALHGGRDPTMPVARVLPFHEWLQGPHQHLVVVPEAGHVTLNDGPCPVGLQLAFLRDPRATLDLSCLDQAAPADWDGDPAFNRSLMGQASRWGGRAR